MSSQLFDKSEVLKALTKIIERGAVFEVRALDAKLSGGYRTGIISGYFDNAGACLKELEKLTTARGIYFTLNPVNRALFSRRANRLAYAEKNSNTGDQHILRRRWLLFDVDFDRPSGISTTDTEKAAAKKKASEIYHFLKERGWPRPVVADSGNNYHLVYRIDLPCEDEHLIERLLAGLADRFDGEGVILDRTVYNPSRIARLHGTLAAKGDNTHERPHRLSKILGAPDTLQLVSVEQLRALVDELQPAEPPPVEQPAAHGGGFDVEEFLARHRVAVAERNTQPDGTIRWRLEHCPFNPDHGTPDAAILQFPGGKLGYKCFHTSCVDKHWKDFRRHFEPEYGSGSLPKVETRSTDDDEQADLTSLSSCAVDYPAPPDEAAYYGLAGEIVRRIEPHTEADPVALLFQLLAAFGNLIGHDHYIVADGARHYLNLYGVLVGQSSKGRKGTSWNHVANVMESVDPEWRRESVSYGLSSGEGLIWEVRDPIEETKPIREKGRHTGEYETFIANHGEADKRLLIIESEFANVLRVMTREGNTLSAVIRSAWDCGDLKTMVKNSPAKATGAHVSIIGHITRDELRRYLTQTESANGFANRFCWLAVKRSKCLPDGGEIHTVNFDEIVAELEAAVSFAKDFVEIRRDPEAKKLWHEVYPRLSEGQPGMSGAVIGRAEAQVMRLSAIYALLDKSRLIRPEHHEAAMDLWRYCEDSARWIFETGTGNKNADRILAALKVVGEKGLTKWQITLEVFNKHATKFEIDEALRLLHGLKVARCERESTATKPAERWFYVPPTREECEQSTPEGGDTSNTSHSSPPTHSQNTNPVEPDTDPGEPPSDVISGDLRL